MQGSRSQTGYTHRNVSRERAGGGLPPLELRSRSIQGYRGHRAAVHGLLAVTRVAGSGVRDPCLVVSQFEYLGTKFCAESATDAKIHINFRSSHM